MAELTIAAIARNLAQKKYSSVELTKEILANAKKANQELNAFITITAEEALRQAKDADKQIAASTATKLTGIPLAHKDNFCTKNIRTTCASKMLADFIAPYNATLVERLQQEGAVLIGKTNMDEFAMGTSNESSYFGPVKNPWNLQCVPGGSSGGSAAAVAAGLIPAATASDTGGSIRQPASFCGVTGLKPTYGRVSRYGMMAFASSLDQAGVITKTAEDAAILLEAIAGHDPKDSTSSHTSIPNYASTLNNSLRGLKIGLPQEYFANNLPTGIALAIDSAITELEKLGARFKEISLPNHELAISAYHVIAPAECSSNLARYDGVRFGYRCEHPQNIKDLFIRSRTEGFGAEVKRRILIGTYVLSSSNYDSYYLKAQKVRTLIKNTFNQALTEVDVILGPTTPTTAFKIGEKASDPVALYLADMFTIAANLAGLPALSIPVGFSEELPVGMQLIGNYFAEGTLLNIAHQYQQVTDWHIKTGAYATNNRS